MTRISYAEANRRYRRAFFPLMLIYVVLCFGGPAVLGWLGEPPLFASALVAIATALPIAGVFWLVARFVRETDEYTRKITVEAMLAGGGFTLSAACFWGFLELLDVVPQSGEFPAMMMVAPTFFGAWGVAYGIQARRR